MTLPAIIDPTTVTTNTVHNTYKHHTLSNNKSSTPRWILSIVGTTTPNHNQNLTNVFKQCHQRSIRELINEIQKHILDLGSATITTTDDTTYSIQGPARIYKIQCTKATNSQATPEPTVPWVVQGKSFNHTNTKYQSKPPIAPYNQSPQQHCGGTTAAMVEIPRS